jgi:hypothetical protein
MDLRTVVLQIDERMVYSRFEPKKYRQTAKPASFPAYQ